MQGHYEPEFDREMGCTAAELAGWLPGASGGASVAWRPDGADVAIGSGRLRLDWQTLPPRRIALIVLPRLRVRFVFERVPHEERQRFMRHFDLYTQRGGG
jgi:hypothetical protein